MEATYEQLKVEFREGVSSIKEGPAEQRSMMDPCCYIFFVLMIIVFIVLGIFVMADQSSALGRAISNPSDTSSSNVLAVVFSKYPGLIAAMFVLSIIISILYLILVRYCLKCVIYTMIVAVFCILFAILVLAIYSNNFGLIVAMSVIMFLLIVFLFCFREELELGMRLMQIANRFIAERPSVYLSGLWVFFLSCLFFVFWAVSVVAVQMRANVHIASKQSTSRENGILAYFIFVYIFMSIFLYYVLSFFIATACSLWYYGREGAYFCTALGRVNRYHLGSFTFAALLLTIIRLLQIIINSSGRQSDNACARCVQCFVSCILSQIQYFLRTLNSIAVVVIAITGKSYCDSAKTAAYLIFDSLGLYSAVSVITNLIMFGGIILAVGIPTIVGLLYCRRNYNPTDTELDHLGLIVFFGTIILVAYILGTLAEALNAVYVLHCLDLRLNQCGCVMATPELIKDMRQYNDTRGVASAQELRHEDRRY